MSQSKSRIPSPSRSQGAPITPRRHRTRRTLSVSSPARSDVSGRLTNVVEQYLKDDKFTISPMRRRSVLPDDTDIEMPKRASWWKRLEGSSRDVLEALDTNQMQGNLLEEFEFEVPEDKQTVQTLPENSDNDSVASIVVPQRKLFNQKRKTQGKFGEIAGSRKSLGKTLLEDQDQTIKEIPKSLFSKGQPRNKPVFPAALLNSTNKTINKTVEPEPNTQGRNLFGQAGTKRKNMFTDFVLSESEDDSIVQHKVFGFKKDNKRMSLASRNRRMPSLTPSVTTDIDIDDWNLLPSSTMIGNGSGAMEGSRIITDKDLELAQNENQDVTVNEADESLKQEASPLNASNKSKKSKSLSRSRFSKSRKLDEDNDKTLTDENIKTEQDSKNEEDLLEGNKSRKSKSVKSNQTRLSKSRKLDDDYNKTLTNENIETEQVSENNVNLPEENKSRNSKSLTRSRLSKSKKLDDDFDKTLTNENIETEQASKSTVDFPEENKSLHRNKTVLSETRKDKTTELQTSKQEIVANDQVHENEENDDTNKQSTENETSIEEQMAELHKESEDESENQIEPSVEQESDKEDEEVNDQESSKEISEQHEDSKQESSKEITDNDQDTTSEPESSKDDSNDKDDTEEQESSKEISNSQDDTKEPENSKEISNSQNDTEEPENSKEDNSDHQDEEMEPMVWSDNDSEKGNTNDDNKLLGKDENADNDEAKVSDHATKIKEIPGNSQRVVESSVVEEEQMEQENDVVEETPNSSYDTTGRNRKKRDTNVESPEAVLKNMSKDDMSFKPMGRSTSFRKSKSAIEDINMRATLIPIQESTIASEGSRNSSTEGSGWDSHRTTRQTLRQTFGKDFTPRKSLRALVMEQAAKRQTLADKSTSKDKTKNKTVEDVIDHDVRDRRVSTNLSSDQLPDPKSPVPDNSTHHVVDPIIAKPQVSYHKLVLEQTNHEKSVNVQDNNDSGPEISIDASYGQGMSREASHDTNRTVDKTNNLEKSNVKTATNVVPMEIEEVIQEELDYDPSVQESTHDAEDEMSEKGRSEVLSDNGRDDSIQELSEQEEEKEESDNEVEAEESEQERESEQELEDEESQQNIEDQEPESEQEVEDEESQQNIEESDVEMEHDESQQEVVESEQEKEMSQQEIESDQQESEQEMEDSEKESENEQINASQESVNEQDSDRDVSDVPEIEIDSEDENDQSERLTERIVFDNEMSDQEIDYEASDRLSRQLTEDESSRQVDGEGQDISVSRFSEPVEELDESIGTKKSVLLKQMQKIAQQNMEIKMKIKEQVKNSLKQTTINSYMPLSNFPMRRITKPEPKKLKTQPRKPTAPFGALPKEFIEDLNYKPPKRYQPATAPWITKRLYKFLETKLEPKYDYRARVRAEELVQTIHSFAKLVRRRDAAPPAAVDELKKEMARLNVVKTHFEFYEFFHDFMPREVRVKVNPDVVNRIPMPRNGIFGDILLSRTDAAA